MGRESAHALALAEGERASKRRCNKTHAEFAIARQKYAVQVLETLAPPCLALIIRPTFGLGKVQTHTNTNSVEFMHTHTHKHTHTHTHTHANKHTYMRINTYITHTHTHTLYTRKHKEAHVFHKLINTKRNHENLPQRQQWTTQRVLTSPPLYRTSLANIGKSISPTCSCSCPANNTVSLCQLLVFTELHVSRFSCNILKCT